MTGLGGEMATSVTHKSANQAQKKDNRLIKEKQPQATEHWEITGRGMNLLCSSMAKLLSQKKSHRESVTELISREAQRRHGLGVT